VNASKRSLALDLKSAGGKEAVLRLVDRADVLIQSMRPGTADRLGFGAETLRERNPKLVYASISAWGTEGPLAPLPGWFARRKRNLRPAREIVDAVPGGPVVK